MSTTPPALSADLEAGLRRLRLGTMRRLAPELLVVAKTQRWKPEEFLRTLLEAEITSRDLSNARNRMQAAAFPVHKTLDEFDVEASSVPRATFDYLASLDRLLHHSVLVPTSGESFRLKEARQRGGRTTLT